MSALVLYQKQILTGVDQSPAKIVSVFKMGGGALEDALKAVRWNYTPHVIAFKELPPEKLLMKACEEAIRAGRGQLLPLAVQPKREFMFKKNVIGSIGK